MIKELRIVEEPKGPLDDPAIVGVEEGQPEPETRDEEKRDRHEDRKEDNWGWKQYDDRRG